MKRMVHIVGNLAPGGMGSFLMNLYRNIDREKVQFDFIVMGEKKQNYHKEAEELGAHIYKVTGLSQNPIKYFCEIRDIIRKNKYDVVFRHTDVATVAIDMLAAKLGGAKKRIPHSHSTDSKHLLVHYLFRPFLRMLSTDYFSCSQPAAEWMYGRKISQKKKYCLIKNGIDLEKYVYDPLVSAKKRKELGIAEGDFVIGHVGNFVYAKNHLFLLEIFAELLKKKPNAKLVLAGDGELRDEIEQKMKELGIKDKAFLLGMRNDIAQLLQAMDIFLFPSIYEGLPVALVEAQASGLPCVISDTIAPESKMTEHIQAYSLNESAEQWADYILELSEYGRADSIEILRSAGYDIMNTVSFYEEFV